MKSFLEAELDFDIVAHLGFVKNIDLAQKGIYSIQISLSYGNELQKNNSHNNKKNQKASEGIRISPIGLFSSPTSVDSYVDSQMVKKNIIDDLK